MRGRQARHARREALLARHHRLPPLRRVLGERVHRGVDHQGAPGGVAILRVHVAGDLLQVDHQPRLEGEKIREMPAQHGDRGVDGALRLAVRGDVAVEMIDERGVERVLPLQRRRDDAPHERSQAPLDAA